MKRKPLVIMVIEKTRFKDLYILHSFNHFDERGQFVKTYNNLEFNSQDIEFTVKETYYSVSKKGVIRGLHFQIPPKAHKKIVYVSNGEIMDIVLDIRKNSPTFGEFLNLKLSAANNKALYIPEGFAHGFESLSDNAVVNYIQSCEHSKDHDSGILWNSIPYTWNTKNPLLSDRDKTFSSFEIYKKKGTHFI